MNDLRELFKLSVEERLQLVENLWDSIEADTRDKPFELSDDEKAELERRISEHEANPGSALDWNEVRARLWAKYK
jgi:putative addiction module component (TIGR02574 family)